MSSDMTWKKKLQPTNIILKLQKWGTRNREAQWDEMKRP